MQNKNSRGATLFASALLVSSCAAEDEQRLSQADFLGQSDMIANQFQAELQKELGTALSEVGPGGAIGVCQSAAPAIAARLSEDSGFTVSRIARRNRNAGNGVPSDLEALYSELEASPMKNGSPRSVHGKVGERLVYLRAIPMQEQPCSTCHGSNIDPELSEVISQSYPEDLAVGFEPGELRGAFLVQTGTTGATE